MSETIRKGGKKNRKIGRQAHHPAHVHYAQSHRRERNKLARVRQSNGLAAAEAYARANGLKVTV